MPAAVRLRGTGSMLQTVRAGMQMFRSSDLKAHTSEPLLSNVV